MPAALPQLLAAADLIRYPASDVAARARSCARALAAVSPEAAGRAERFAAAAEATGAGALEEAYTAAFDLAPIADLYVGHALFGDTPPRSTLLARLAEMRREHDLAPSPEMPDHLSEVLRLAAAMPAGAERDDLVADGALPAARGALRALEAANHPYAEALGALVAAVESCIARHEPASAEIAP